MATNNKFKRRANFYFARERITPVNASDQNKWLIAEIVADLSLPVITSQYPPHQRKQRLLTRESDSQLRAIWIDLANEYFPNQPDLCSYTICWSTRRQKRTLASVSLTRRLVIVAQELKDELFWQYLPPLIYHEMCHAVISTSVKTVRGRRQWHGKEFKELERQHPEIKALEEWIKNGGWRYAVARHRAIASYKKRRNNKLRRPPL